MQQVLKSRAFKTYLSWSYVAQQIWTQILEHHMVRVSRQKGSIWHAQAWRVGPF